MEQNELTVIIYYKKTLNSCYVDFTENEYIINALKVLDGFKNGGDIYCATASKMFNKPVEKQGRNAELRQKGKIATLALGYGGAVSESIYDEVKKKIRMYHI